MSFTLTFPITINENGRWRVKYGGVRDMKGFVSSLVQISVKDIRYLYVYVYIYGMVLVCPL